MKLPLCVMDLRTRSRRMVITRKLQTPPRSRRVCRHVRVAFAWQDVVQFGSNRPGVLPEAFSKFRAKGKEMGLPHMDLFSAGSGVSWQEVLQLWNAAKIRASGPQCRICFDRRRSYKTCPSKSRRNDAPAGRRTRKNAFSPASSFQLGTYCAQSHDVRATPLCTGDGGHGPAAGTGLSPAFTEPHIEH